MFIYGRKGSMCITFKGNKPVDNPEYVITIDSTKEKVYVNGVDVCEPKVETKLEEPVIDTKAKTKTSKIKEPEVSSEETAVTTEE